MFQSVQHLADVCARMTAGSADVVELLVVMELD